VSGFGRIGMAASAAALLAMTASGCFMLAFGSLLAPSPNRQTPAPIVSVSSLSLTGDLIVPSELTATTPLNNTTPLTATTPLSNVTPLIGNSGAGLIGNAGSGLAGGSGGALAGGSGGALAGGPGGGLTGKSGAQLAGVSLGESGYVGFMPSSAFYRLLAVTLPSGLPEPEVEVIDSNTGLSLATDKPRSARYTLNVKIEGERTGYIVQAFFKRDGDVLAFLASPVSAPTTGGATADLSLGSTVTALSLARVAGVEAEKLKLGKGFRDISSKDLAKLAAASAAQDTDLTAASNVVYTSKKFDEVLNTAGAFAREVGDKAIAKAKEALSEKLTQKEPEVAQVAATLGLINKVAEVVTGGGTVGKALDQAVAEVDKTDVATRADAQVTVEKGPEIRQKGTPTAISRVAELARAAITCVPDAIHLAWREAGNGVIGILSKSGLVTKVGGAAAGNPALAAIGARVIGASPAMFDGSPILQLALFGKDGSAAKSGTLHPSNLPQTVILAGSTSSAAIVHDDGPALLNALLDASGSHIATSSFTLTASTSLDPRRPAAVALGDTFLAVWDEKQPNGAGRRIMSRFIAATGKPKGDAPIQLWPESADTRFRGAAAVAVGTSGFLVVWTEESGGFADIKGLALDFAGKPTASAFDIANTPFDQRNPVVAWTGTRFVIGWDDRRQGRRTIAGRAMTAKGVLGPEATLVSANQAQTPSLTACGGNAAITWLEGSGFQAILNLLRIEVIN
jgi:hypothetical protein